MKPGAWPAQVVVCKAPGEAAQCGDEARYSSEYSKLNEC
jgi:hypothetical protein